MVMRVVLAFLAVAMAVFAAVQYNDPDGPLWAVYYGVPAIWAALAAIRPAVLATSIARTLLGATLIAALALTVFYWPPVGGWWREEVWSMSLTEERAARAAEQSREGMGMMIATAVLFVVVAAAILFSRPKSMVSRAGLSPSAK